MHRRTQSTFDDGIPAHDDVQNAVLYHQVRVYEQELATKQLQLAEAQQALLSISSTLKRVAMPPTHSVRVAEVATPPVEAVPSSSDSYTTRYTQEGPPECRVGSALCAETR